MGFKSLFARYFTFLTISSALSGAVFCLVIFRVFSRTNLPIQAGICFAAAIAISFVIAKILAKNTVKPIQEIIAVARTIENGQKPGFITLDRKDEFADLADGINKLTDRDKAIRDANEDPLTGLANRRYLMQRLEGALEHKQKVALVFMDLDGFKPINDDFGHDVGDEALRTIADRLNACIRETDVLCRLGGDEFVILFSGLTDRKSLTERADKILELIGMPMWISGNRIRMGASLGIACSPEDGKDAETLINAADESMYAAKQGGKNAYRFYS
jgi:diguanylate cyclase (GGDEF)-like protein